jgi:hypothetical protein
VTIAIRPSEGWDGAGDKAVSTKQGSEKFLQTRLDWWNQIDLLQQIARLPEPALRHSWASQSGTTDPSW